MARSAEELKRNPKKRKKVRHMFPEEILQEMEKLAQAGQGTSVHYQNLAAAYQAKTGRSAPDFVAQFAPPPTRFEPSGYLSRNFC
jgi:hypothetical protein